MSDDKMNLSILQWIRRKSILTRMLRPFTRGQWMLKLRPKQEEQE